MKQEEIERASEIGNLSCGDCLMNKTEVVHFVALDSEVGHAVAADLRAKFFAPRAQR